jgi:tetratricopeptide (TPR) repeat protein
MLNHMRRQIFKSLVGGMTLMILFVTGLWLPIVVHSAPPIAPPMTTPQPGDRQMEFDRVASEIETLLSLERYQAAMTQAMQLLAASQAANAEVVQAKALTYLGIAAENLGRYADAIAHYKQAATLFHRLKLRHEFGVLLLNLGSLRSKIGAYDRAENLYKKSLEIALDLKDQAIQGKLLTNLGGLYVAMGQFKRADRYLQDALKLHQSRGDILGQTQVLTNLGALRHFNRQLPAAIDYYQQALGLARQAKNQQLEVDLLSSLGIAYGDQTQSNKAIAFHSQAVALAKTLDLPETLASALNNQADTLYIAKQYPAALVAVNQSIHLLEGMRPGLDDKYKVSIFDTQLQSYRSLEQILVAANQPEAALEAAEQGRGRALAELLSGRGEQSPIAPINLTEIRRIAQVQKATIVEYSLVPDIDFRFLGKQQAPSERLLIWVVQPTGKITLRQVDLKRDRATQGTIPQLVAAARCLNPKPICPSVGEVAKTRGLKITSVKPTAAAATPSSPLPKPNLQDALSYPGLPELHKILIAPIADLLPSNPDDRVIFVPQDSLFLLPFAALVDAQGNYLIQQHTMLTVPSIQVLGLIQRPASAWQNPQQLVVLGNPSPMPESLEPLPAAEQEAIAVAKRLNTQPLIGPAATRQNLLSRLGQAKLVHLATHGLLEAGQVSALDAAGAIALTPTADDAGLLTATEIAGLKTQADLVVLSACDTGRGTITGDGVLGLARSWMAAGASSVVVSLWAVNDQSTSDLMQAFYQGLVGRPDDRQSAKGDRAVALRQAMLKTMQQYPSPYDWAAFSLMGQPGG